MKYPSTNWSPVTVITRIDKQRTSGQALDVVISSRGATCLRGFPASLLDVFFRLVAEFDLQLLRLDFQILLTLGQSFSGLKDVQCLKGPPLCERQYDE